MWFSRLPLSGKIAFVLIWPLSIPYMAFEVWARKPHWSVFDKIAATAGLMVAFFAMALLAALTSAAT